MAVIRISEIHESDHAALAAHAVAETIDRLGKRVFTKQDLLHLIAEHREEWRILDRVPPKKVLDYLLTAFPLRKTVLDGPDHSQEFQRYLWRDADPIEVAASIRSPSSYLCHSSALFMHRLVDHLPKELCVNYEQSPKAKISGDLTQASLTRAFQGEQRQSAFTFRYKKHVIVVLSGKNTGRFEVQPLSIATGATVQVTSLERTLIDVTVRPIYAGGVHNVLQAFRRAQDRVSIDKIISTLQKLDHVYPYHQAIGFYLDRAGYPRHLLARFQDIRMDFDFYLAHGMRETTYDKDWKLHYPRGL
jgi:predicted transcriptional regulator of viral defense system